MTANQRKPSFRTPLCERLGIDVPIFSFSHSLEVTAAVSRAGGYGVFGATHDTPEQIREHARRLKEMCEGRPFGLDLLLPAVAVEKDDHAAAQADRAMDGRREGGADPGGAMRNPVSTTGRFNQQLGAARPTEGVTQ